MPLAFVSVFYAPLGRQPADISPETANRGKLTRTDPGDIVPQQEGVVQWRLVMLHLVDRLV